MMAGTKLLPNESALFLRMVSGRNRRRSNRRRTRKTVQRTPVVTSTTFVTSACFGSLCGDKFLDELVTAAVTHQRAAVSWAAVLVRSGWPLVETPGRWCCTIDYRASASSEVGLCNPNTLHNEKIGRASCRERV